MDFEVIDSVEIVLQVAPAKTSGALLDEHIEISLDGVPLGDTVELVGPHGTRLHVVKSRGGHLSINYRSEIERLSNSTAPNNPSAPITSRMPTGFPEILYLRPSRYCPTDHLDGFAIGEFGTGGAVGARVNAITQWIQSRIEYLPGSGTVHDSAEDTLLTCTGSCRDFAHLSVALCRAIGIPARFTAVYAPGLSPMDFHAVFEVFQEGRWLVHDATCLAPRTSMVRIVTGRDAADAAFAEIIRGSANFLNLEVGAVAQPILTSDNRSIAVELA
jgi:transglutaminase-like putative cysteine protease